MKMADTFSVISTIAERRIQEAIKNGELDNLPGQGQALVLEDLSHVPPELRLAYKILKNSGCLPPELERRKEMARLADILDSNPSEKEKLRHIRKLRYLLQKAAQERSQLSLAWEDEYYSKILARLEAHERKNRAFHSSEE